MHTFNYLNSKYKKSTYINLIVKCGFSLLEIMIGIFISAIITLGIAGVYFNIRTTQNAQNSISEIRDSGFIALDRLEYAVKHAKLINFSEQRDPRDNKIVPVNQPFIASETTNTTVANTSDQFAVDVSVPDSSNEIVDCAGASVPNNTVAEKYILSQRFTVNTNSLYCNVKTTKVNLQTDATTIVQDFSTNPTELVKGISNMQMFYATNDVEGCGVTVPSSVVAAANNPWKTASEITAANQWQNVCAVNISLLSSSQTGQVVNSNDPASSKVFDLRPNTDITDSVAQSINFTSSNGILKNTRVINRVIYLRN